MYKPSCEGLSLDGRVVLVRNILPPDQTPMQALQSLGESRPDLSTCPPNSPEGEETLQQKLELAYQAL